MTGFNRQYISDCIGISSEQYELIIIERAFQYIESNITSDSIGCEILITSNHFWEWWNQQWDNRNDQLLAATQSPHTIDLDTMIAIINGHQRIHSIQSLSAYPVSAILENSYSEVVRKIFKSKHK